MVIAAAAAEGQCVSEARVISTRQSVPNLVAGPAAFGNGVLALAKYERGPRRVFIATYDQNFDQLSGDVLIADNTADGPLHLIWNGVDFGLFYRTLNPQRLMLQRISTAGQPIGSPIPVSSRTIDVTEDVDVVWSTALNAYVIATTYEPGSNRDVWVTVMDRSGIVLRDLPTNVFATKDESFLNVAVTSDGTIGVFYRSDVDESIYFAHITPTAPGAPVDQVWSRGRDLEVVAHGNRFYLTKTIEVAGKTEVRWLVLESSGAVVVPDSLLFRGSDIAVRPVSFISTGTELAIAYIDSALGFDVDSGELRLRRFTPSGALISDALFVSADPLQRFALAEHEIVWTGSAFVTPAVYEFGRELDSLLVRLCPLHATIGVDRLVATTNDTITFTALPTGGTPAFRYTWDMGDRSGTRTGQVVRHRFIHTGAYDVVVTVTDDAGVVTTAAIRVTIVNMKQRAVRK